MFGRWAPLWDLVLICTGWLQILCSCIPHFNIRSSLVLSACRFPTHRVGPRTSLSMLNNMSETVVCSNRQRLLSGFLLRGTRVRPRLFQLISPISPGQESFRRGLAVECPAQLGRGPGSASAGTRHGTCGFSARFSCPTKCSQASDAAAKHGVKVDHAIPFMSISRPHFETQMGE